MNRIVCFSLLTLSLNFTNLQAQESDGFKFHLMGLYGMGFGVMENSNEADYNYSVRKFDGLMSFDFGKRVGFATGAGVNRIHGNGFNTNGNFVHKRTTIRIPILMTIDEPISDNFDFYVNGGFIWETI